MKKTAITELTPSSSRKSFYGKAKVIEKDGTHYLCSYSTIVGSVDKAGKVHRYWDGRTNTTTAHIASFLKQFTDIGTTKEFYALPCEKAPTVTVTL